jgi:hypothetical protein
VTTPPPKTVEQCLIVHFEYGLPDTNGMYEQAERLKSALSNAGVGEYDGHEIALALTDGFYYMYGPDADLLLEVAEPVFRSTSWFRRAEITRRYGPPTDGVKRVVTTYAA